MKYIENDGHITREYDVMINEQELERIIRELDEKCYRLVYKRIKVAAYDKDKAIERVNSAINSAGIKTNELVRISDGYKDLVSNPSAPYIYDCDCFYRQSCGLVNILNKIIENYRSSLNFNKQDSWLIDFLIEYRNSEELKPYSIRKKELKEKIDSEIDRGFNDLEYLYNLQKEAQEFMQESRLNPNFDFELLINLYAEAKRCFELVLVSETIHYKDADKNNKVYKLGEIKTI